MPIVKPNDLPVVLDKQLSQLYVIHGDDFYLAHEAAHRVREAAYLRGYRERQLVTLEGQPSWSALPVAINDTSLFAELKFLEIRIPSGKPGVEGANILSQIACSPPADTLILISLPKLDRLQQQSKWFLTLLNHATTIPVTTLDRAAFSLWIAQRLNKQQQAFTDEAMDFFIEYVEGNTLAAHQEIEKLALLFGPGKLDLDKIRPYIANLARYDVFELGESWLSGNATRLIRLLRRLREEGVSPILVLWSLTEDIRLLLRLNQGLQNKRPMRELAKELRLWGEKLKFAEQAAKRIRLPTLTSALCSCAQIDREIKGSSAGDPWISLEKLSTSLACSS